MADARKQNKNIWIKYSNEQVTHFIKLLGSDCVLRTNNRCSYHKNMRRYFRRACIPLPSRIAILFTLLMHRVQIETGRSCAVIGIQSHLVRLNRNMSSTLPDCLYKQTITKNKFASLRLQTISVIVFNDSIDICILLALLVKGFCFGKVILKFETYTSETSTIDAFYVYGMYFRKKNYNTTSLFIWLLEKYS